MTYTIQYVKVFRINKLKTLNCQKEKLSTLLSLYDYKNLLNFLIQVLIVLI